jgi:hypothetical protein
VSGKRLFVNFFAFSIGGTTSLSFFKLAAEGEAVFTLSRAWTTTSLLNEGKINRVLIEGNGSRDEICNGTDICIGVPVWLASLAVRIKGLVDGGGQ